MSFPVATFRAPARRTRRPVQPSKPYTFHEFQREVRAEMARKGHTQEDAAGIVRKTRAYFGRALNAEKPSPAYVAVLAAYMKAAAGLKVETEVRFRAVRDGGEA